MRIAVVDDDSVMVALVTRICPGHDIAAFSGAKLLLELISAGERFDVIVTDLIMPGFTGQDFYAQLRTIAPAQAARVLFITGGHAPEDVDVPTLTKPFNHTLLLEMVERIGQGERPS